MAHRRSSSAPGRRGEEPRRCHRISICAPVARLPLPHSSDWQAALGVGSQSPEDEEEKWKTIKLLTERLEHELKAKRCAAHPRALRPLSLTCGARGVGTECQGVGVGAVWRGARGVGFIFYCGSRSKLHTTLPTQSMA